MPPDMEDKEGHRKMKAENYEKIFKKIENLLALAGNNPNKNEAIAAALKAQKLMAKYNIELADVQGEDTSQKIVKEVYCPHSRSHYVSQWKYALSHIIAKNFCCKTYNIARKSIVFYGYEKDARIAREVFKFLYETGNRLAVRYYNKCRKEGKNTTGVLNTYLVGFCNGIKEILDKQCTALMIVIPKEVEEAYEEHSKDFRKISHKLKTSNDERAYREGRRDGRDTVMSRTVEG